jgi:hypothetical protein
MVDHLPADTFIAVLEDYRRLSKEPLVWIHGRIGSKSCAMLPHCHPVNDGTQSVNVLFDSALRLDPSRYYHIQLSFQHADNFTATEVNMAEDHRALYDAYCRCLLCLDWLTAQQEQEDHARVSGFSGRVRDGGLDDETVYAAVRLFRDPNITTLAVYLGVANIGEELDPTLSRLVQRNLLAWNDKSYRFTVNE